jgi:methyltransferase
MVALHTAFLASCVAEVWLLDRPWRPVVGLVSMLVLVAAFGLRWWTLKTLGNRWTTRVVVVPGETLVSSGPYQWLRHPNYVAVVLEIAAIPMIHCAWITAVVFSVANLVLLTVRVRAEEGALKRISGGGK